MGRAGGPKGRCCPRPRPGPPCSRRDVRRKRSRNRVCTRSWGLCIFFMFSCARTYRRGKGARVDTNATSFARQTYRPSAIWSQQQARSLANEWTVVSPEGPKPSIAQSRPNPRQGPRFPWPDRAVFSATIHAFVGWRSAHICGRLKIQKSCAPSHAARVGPF